MVIFISSAGDTPPPPPVTSDGVLFDGNDYFLKASGLTGETATDALSYVHFFLTGSDGVLFQSGITGNSQAGIDFSVSGGKFRYELRRDAGALLTGASNDTISTGAYKCVMFSRSNSAVKLYNGDTSLARTDSVANTSGNIPVTDGTIGLMANRVGSSRFSGQSGFMVLLRGVAIDFDVEANRRIFFNSNGTPTSAATVLAQSPILFMQGNKDAWPSNQGSGGSFTQYGLLDNGTTPILV